MITYELIKQRVEEGDAVDIDRVGVYDLELFESDFFFVYATVAIDFTIIDEPENNFLGMENISYHIMDFQVWDMQEDEEYVLTAEQRSELLQLLETQIDILWKH